MGSSQIYGCPFREPWVFKIDHIILLGFINLFFFEF
jgi:hypothetical protein